MRFVRCLAAMAAFVCSTVAGQAGAVTLYKYTYTSGPTAAVPVSFWFEYAKPGVPSGRIDRYRIKGPQRPALVYAFTHTNGPVEGHITTITYESYTSAGYIFGGGTFPKLDTLAPGEYVDPKAGSKLTLETTSYVPEPATWGLLILGFGATGQALRARRRRAAPVTA